MRGNPDARQGAIALHGFYFLYYGLQGVSIPFLPLWFASRGLDPAFIGLIVATSFLPKIVSTPFVAHVADRTGHAHVLIAIALAASLAPFACYPVSAAPAPEAAPASKEPGPSPSTLRRRLEESEAALAKASQLVADLDVELANPDVYVTSPERAAALGARRVKAQEALDAAEAKWLEAAEKLEAAS